MKKREEVFWKGDTKDLRVIDFSRIDGHFHIIKDSSIIVRQDINEGYRKAIVWKNRTMLTDWEILRQFEDWVKVPEVD